MLRSESLFYVESVCRGHEALLLHFEVVRGDVPRITKEYNLVYVPTTNEWLGDVIAYGQWWDLEPEEVASLRKEYGLDVIVERAAESFALILM